MNDQAEAEALLAGILLDQGNIQEAQNAVARARKFWQTARALRRALSSRL